MLDNDIDVMRHDFNIRSSIDAEYREILMQMTLLSLKTLYRQSDRGKVTNIALNLNHDLSSSELSYFVFCSFSERNFCLFLPFFLSV